MRAKLQSFYQNLAIGFFGASGARKSDPLWVINTTKLVHIDEQAKSFAYPFITVCITLYFDFYSTKQCTSPNTFTE